MTRAFRLIEKIDNAVRPNNAANKKDDWEYACDEPVDREPTSWRSVAFPSKTKVVSSKGKMGRGHTS